MIIHSNDHKAAINTALSLQQFGIECHLVTTKKYPYDPNIFATINEEGVEGTSIPAGILFLRKPSKKLKAFRGDETYENYGDLKKNYDYLVLNDDSLVQWFDYYNIVVKKLGGYYTNFLWRE